MFGIAETAGSLASRLYRAKQRPSILEIVVKAMKLLSLAGRMIRFLHLSVRNEARLGRLLDVFTYLPQDSIERQQALWQSVSSWLNLSESCGTRASLVGIAVMSASSLVRAGPTHRDADLLTDASCLNSVAFPQALVLDVHQLIAHQVFLRASSIGCPVT